MVLCDYSFEWGIIVCFEIYLEGFCVIKDFDMLFFYREGSRIMIGEVYLLFACVNILGFYRGNFLVVIFDVIDKIVVLVYFLI